MAKVMPNLFAILWPSMILRLSRGRLGQAIFLPVFLRLPVITDAGGV
jgi:hypothetical protein